MERLLFAALAESKQGGLVAVEKDETDEERQQEMKLPGPRGAAQRGELQTVAFQWELPNGELSLGAGGKMAGAIEPAAEQRSCWLPGPVGGASFHALDFGEDQRSHWAGKAPLHHQKQPQLRFATPGHGTSCGPFFEEFCGRVTAKFKIWA